MVERLQCARSGLSMKILWVKSDFLHPATKGGHIRTLEMLKRLHSRHEIHYVALDLPDQAGGVERSSEYCAKAYPIPHRVPQRPAPGFWLQASAAPFIRLPLAVSRYVSPTMQRRLEMLTKTNKFDAVVCDFLFAAPNIPDLASAILFEHNVEALIWKRHADHASSRLQRLYFHNQHRKMRRYEGVACRAAKRVVTVSEDDARLVRSEYDAPDVHAVPTGVDVEYFAPPPSREPAADLLFLGSMDWMPNVDAVCWFAAEVLPLIRRRRPNCTLSIAGRRPTAEIRKLAEDDSRIHVTGTVPDVRPYLWGAAVAIVPLRIGGGTRLKIYEAMAAQIPVVSTSIGAEGLDVRDGETIAMADDPRQFADACLALLDDAGLRNKIARAAWEMVSACYSWEVVTRKFEQLLE
jgi:glycosyltransferase involved in cell wall biosynthesis